ncbi:MULTISPECIES: Xaa-Pro peptidase family protein [unclassified Shinella]|uniref:M24 family metallopeptidase n=1 Tax=unclassified Shinella TaxID=2643062 RepID=UPI00225C5B7A|nr:MULTISPECIES: Xaa-Pro peptidase family protein [unclassified Shinella]MCO5139543.1 Xaa-Pro peptidase family protein [Shinella sp.]MDC7258458.1 Xaa-Pro peptidase family protein [Shinella sp. YE25]CAI0334794.1 Aminopeptidase P family protein [Rhizobiaceae bacterium]CAK7260220.1 Xaa-Pro dipeptidase [Shinella sp. WSC3-e]
MRAEIVAKQVRAMAEHGLDAIICSSPENFAYTAGFVVPSQPLIRHRHAMTIVTADGRSAIFGVDMEASTIKRRMPDVPSRIWAEFSDDPMLVLADQLSGLGLAAARIGLEMDYLPAGDFARLIAAMPGARFEHAEPILARLRQIKTAEEITLLSRLSRIADQAIADALAEVDAGDSEMDIAGHLTRNVYSLGAEHFKLLIVATGERSVLPNVGPSDRILKRGDVCRVEIFSVIDGYQAGVCRTAIVGEAPPMADKIWTHLVECKYEIMEKVKPGASCRAIYDAFIAKLAKLDLPPISFVGHGIGLHLHEDPYLGLTPVLGKPGSDAPLEENMVLGFEPLCYNTGYGFGMQNKDMLLVTSNGSELLSDYTNTDKLIVCGTARQGVKAQAVA